MEMQGGGRESARAPGSLAARRRGGDYPQRTRARGREPGAAKYGGTDFLRKRRTGGRAPRAGDDGRMAVSGSLRGARLRLLRRRESKGVLRRSAAMGFFTGGPAQLWRSP